MKSLKRILSLLLCVSLILTTASAAYSKTEDELKFTVAADTHFYCAADAGEVVSDGTFTEGMLDSNVFFHATFQGQMNHESGAIFRSMLSDFVKSDSEYLLIAGDLTCGKRQSHLEFAQLLRDAEHQSGKQIFVICGNHDCDDSDFDTYIGIDEFISIYNDFGFGDAVARDEKSASYTADLSDKYRLMAIDSCIYGEDDGEIRKSTLSWIEEQTQKAHADGKEVIAMMHHSLLPHFSLQPMMDNWSDLADTFASLGIKLVFTGHIHANDISMAQDKNGNTVYDVQTGSLITSPGAYRQVTLSDGAIDIKSKCVTEIDTAYLPQGFNDEQLEAIRSDFPAYAYGYFEAGICRWLNRYIGSAGKLGKTLKLKNGSKAYEALDSLLRNVGEALALPIYDDGLTPDCVDSIEEIAENVGVKIPASDYERVYQAAARVMNGFYHGDEQQAVKEKEWPLLYACLKAVIARAVSNIAFSTKTAKGFNELMKKSTGIDLYGSMLRCTSAVTFTTGAADRLLESLLVTLCEGLLTDLSEPADIDVTLTGYSSASTGENTVPLGFFERFIAVFVKIRNIFSSVF